MSTIKSGVSKTTAVRSAVQRSPSRGQDGENASVPDGAEQDIIVKNWRNQNACNRFVPYLHDDHHPDPCDLDIFDLQA